MGNILCLGDKDEAWKQQNKEMVENPVYKFADLSKGGSLIDAFNSEGPRKVMEIAENEMSSFFYSKDGRRHLITEGEFLRWKWKSSQRAAGLDATEKISEEKLKAENVGECFNKITPHEACWDLDKRGGVGETPFHLLCLMDSPVHFEVAKILLKMYPNLALDIYEGDEYYGESALHIAVVIGDLELVHLLVEAGANVNQRATGRFFLPEDQKKGYSKQTNYDGYAYYGEYPLAFAACLGKSDIYDYLLCHGANPNLQDVFGNSIAHMLVIYDQTDMYRYAVRHHKLPASTSIKNNQNLTPLALACKLGRQSIFREMLEIDSIEFWSFSTTLCSAHPLHTLDSVGPDGSTNWNSALMIIVNGDKDDHLDMLDGGVMRQLLIEKWKTFAKRCFMSHLFFAVIHLILFSVCVYTRPMGHSLLGYRGPIDTVRFTSEVIVSLNCLAKVVYEIMDISTQGMDSFLKNCAHAPAQAVYLVSCLLVLACVPCRFTRLYNVEDVLVILAAPCAWSIMLFFARGYMLTGPFVTMIYKMILGDLLRFGIIYIIFLSGFSQAFFFLFRDINNEEKDPDLDKFSTFPETVLKLFQMSFGEFKYDVFSVSHYSALTKIIFALFMILVPILLLNMLIAMMGHTHTKIISKSSKEWWKQWAKIVIVLEKGISRKNLQQYQKAYSVRLAGAPPPSDGSPPPQEQRALVVIRMCSKSRARKRKEALFKWKVLSREIIRQLRHKKNQEQPFQLKESLRKGQLLNEQSQTMLTNTVVQLAWEKDIDLLKSHELLAGKDNIHSYSPPLQSADLHQPSSHALPGLAVKADGLKQCGSSSKLYDRSDVKKRRHLLYNRVSPLLTCENKNEEMHLSDSSDNFLFEDSESVISDLVFQNLPDTNKQVTCNSASSSSRQDSSSTSHLIKSQDRISQSMFPLVGISSTSKTEEYLIKYLVRSKQHRSHDTQENSTESPQRTTFNPDSSSPSVIREVHSTVVSSKHQSQNAQSSFTVLPETASTTQYWIEGHSVFKFSGKKDKKPKIRKRKKR